MGAMNTITFFPARLCGAARPPASKSEAHRALLLAALGEGECRVRGLEGALCGDTRAMLRGIAALGADAVRDGDCVVVVPGARRPERTADMGACAAALRMLIPAFAAKGLPCALAMDEALRLRPLSAFDGMRPKPFAVTVSGGAAHIEGALPAGAYSIGGGVSSQFASGLLLALSAHAGRESRVTVEAPVLSRPYLSLTCDMLRRFGCSAAENGDTFTVCRPSLRNPPEIALSADFTQAAALLCAGAGAIGLDAGAYAQGDSRIVSLLGETGLRERLLDGALYMVCPSRARLRPLCADLSANPDLAPMLALACTRARGVSRLTGLSALRVKECDRLLAIREILCALGADVSTDGDALVIAGGAPLRGGVTLDARGDHRMAMMLAFAAAECREPVTVTGADAVSKSWPSFYEAYRALGGSMKCWT